MVSVLWCQIAMNCHIIKRKRLVASRSESIWGCTHCVVFPLHNIYKRSLAIHFLHLIDKHLESLIYISSSLTETIIGAIN